MPAPRRDPDLIGDAGEGAGRHGTAVPRGQDADAVRDPRPGRFGRMFPCRSACDADPEAIEELIAWLEAADHPFSQDNTNIPAGFTYLGQFIDHDITFDPTSKLDRRIDPGALENFRTPRFDLDSVYGSGPVAEPSLYDWKESAPPGIRLLVGHNAVDGTADLPRNQQGRAVIGDPRNDENVIVAQLHLLFIRFHNAVVDRLLGTVPDRDLLADVQQAVRWHYQWIIVHEFLPKVVGEEMATATLGPAAGGHRHFVFEDEPFIPVEFSGAAYRFGHSMVRGDYILKRRVDDEQHFGIPLFPDLAGFTWLPRDLVIDWERFFELADHEPQSSLRMDTALARPLLHLPDRPKTLIRLNLERGTALELPSGQDVAGALHERALTEEELMLGENITPDARKKLVGSTPLWYYILREAMTRLGPAVEPGSRLGPVGGRIVAEVLVGLLERDRSSFVNEDPTWRPWLGQGGDFTMADLVRVAQS
jgi:Animal haem peroxidase